MALTLFKQVKLDDDLSFKRLQSFRLAVTSVSDTGHTLITNMITALYLVAT